MNKKIRIALAQINPVVGDLRGNERKIAQYIEEAKSKKVDLIAFPELSITGYPPEDLLLRSQFIEDNLQCLRRLTDLTKEITAFIGFVDLNKTVYNAAAILHDGKWYGSYHKIHLPNYGVFDEIRYFTPGNHIPLVRLNDIRIGLNICEDIWIPDSITETQVIRGGADLIINLSSSPYHWGKREEREAMLKKRARDNIVCICYVNLIGGQDELVFDGHSLIVNESGQIVMLGRQFAEDFIICDLDLSEIQSKRALDAEFLKKKIGWGPGFTIDEFNLSSVSMHQPKPAIELNPRAKLNSLEEIYQALVLGTRDYILKNGFKAVVIGLSGGIDSALTAAIAVSALGAKSVIGVSMPSAYSSEGSMTDAYALAENLGIQSLTIPIQPLFESYKMMFREVFRGLAEDITEENIQARIRGNILMALSNKFGWLPLTTGNKSEISVGYCTLYGDMAGGFSVIKDVPKTMVYKLSRLVNEKMGREIIPVSTLTKPASAELKAGQKDEDTLPPYDILDPILYLYVEKDYDLKRIVKKGFDEEVVKEVIRMVDNSEYKRRQAPPGVRITPKAFGKDRRFPITNHYRF